jgi:hypothetical protein
MYQNGQLDEALDALTQASSSFRLHRGLRARPRFTTSKARPEKALYARGMVAYSNGEFDDAAQQLRPP